MSNETTVNVLDFGAKGDGVTNDSEAIQAAIDKAVELGTGVEFPPGLYRIGQPLTGDVRIVGCAFEGEQRGIFLV